MRTDTPGWRWRRDPGRRWREVAADRPGGGGSTSPASGKCKCAPKPVKSPVRRGETENRSPCWTGRRGQCPPAWALRRGLAAPEPALTLVPRPGWQRAHGRLRREQGCLTGRGIRAAWPPERGTGPAAVTGGAACPRPKAAAPPAGPWGSPWMRLRLSGQFLGRRWRGRCGAGSRQRRGVQLASFSPPRGGCAQVTCSGQAWRGSCRCALGAAAVAGAGQLARVEQPRGRGRGVRGPRRVLRSGAIAARWRAASR